MEETRVSRDLPVLDAVVSLLDESPGEPLFGSAVVARTALEISVVKSALFALSPDYVVLGRELSAEDSGLGLQLIDGVTAEARRVVGQWPTGEDLVEKLAAGLNGAVERETDPETKKGLRDGARALGGAAKYIAIDIARQLIERQIPGAH